MKRTGERPPVPVPAAVVFDLDGTLVDSMGRFLDVYRRSIRALGGPSLRREDVEAAFHVGSTADVLAHFLERAVGEEELGRFYALAAEAAAAVRPFPGVPEMLDGLRSAGLPVGLFTGATRRGAELLLESCRLGHHFGAIVAGDEVSRPKPCEEGLLSVCAALGVPPAAVAYVGDTQVDVDCARRAGSLSIVASWSPAAAGVTGADAVAARPADVPPLVRPGR